MIVEVVYEMRSFIFILFVTIVALGDSFLRIAELGDSEDEDNLPMANFFSAAAFSYEMSLGAFDSGTFGNKVYLMVYILFMINTLFNTIVMLNLLIAIMMEAYTKIAGETVGASY